MLFRRLPKDSTTSWKLALSANRPKHLNLNIGNTHTYGFYSTLNILNLNDTIIKTSVRFNNNNNNNSTNISWNKNYSTNVSKKLSGLSYLHTDSNSSSSSSSSATTTETSPYYNQLCAFDDNVNQILMDKNFRRPGFNTKDSSNNYSSISNSQNVALFWDSITRAIHIYQDLAGVCPDMNQYRVSALINLIHNGLRINRFQLIKLNKKPDYDSKSFHHEMIRHLTITLHSIMEDILSHKVSINEYGLMHLLSSMKELNLHLEIIQLWEIASRDPVLKDLFLQPKCLGVLLPIFYQYGNINKNKNKNENENNTIDYSFSNLKSLYEQSLTKLPYTHPNLICGMIQTSLMANEPRYALELFDQLSQLADNANMPNKKTLLNYLTDAHLSFIGNCSDINIAETFWSKACNNEMPYKINLQVSYINSFLNNIWQQTQDFDKVLDVWLTMVDHYNQLNLNLGIFSSLNNTFMDIFFNYKFVDDKIAGFKKLNHILNLYQSRRPIDEPLLNIILTKGTLSWNDKNIYDHIRHLYQLYNIPETIITKRILLKTLGSLNNGAVSTNDIWNQWIELILKLDSMGQKYIANADWAAIRDATLTRVKKNDSTATQREESKKRAELYVKIVNLFALYCRDPQQRDQISRNTVSNYHILKPYWGQGQFQNIGHTGLEIPQLNSLQPQP